AAMFENVLCLYLTTPKPQVWFESVETPAATLRRACRQTGCRLDRRSKMLYTAQALFLNGEKVDAALASSALLRQLADQQNLSAAQVQTATSAELAALADWCAIGWLQPGCSAESLPW
ncbi:MAG: winged helix domain-containing protein, partial [Thiomonas sp.]